MKERARYNTIAWAVTIAWVSAVWLLTMCSAHGMSTEDRSAAEARCARYSQFATFGGAQALRGKKREIQVIQRGTFLEKFAAGQLKDLPGMAMWDEDATPENVEAVFAGWDWVQRANAERSEIPADAKSAGEMFYRVCWESTRT